MPEVKRLRGQEELGPSGAARFREPCLIRERAAQAGVMSHVGEWWGVRAFRMKTTHAMERHHEHVTETAP